MDRRGRRPTRQIYYLRSIVRLLTGFRNPFHIVRIFSPSPPSFPTTVRLRNDTSSFRVRGATDVWSVKETWLDRFYERYGFPIEPDWTVVDIGAGIGEFTLFAARAKADVIAFEPSPSSFVMLRKNIDRNDATSIRAFEAAVTGASGTTRIEVENDPLISRSGADGVDGVEVRATSLRDAMSDANIDSIDLLKIDCEGGEYDIFAGADPGTLRRVHRIVMEYHDIDSDHTHDWLVHYLTSAGYRVETFPNPVHTWTGFLRADRTVSDHAAS